MSKSTTLICKTYELSYIVTKTWQFFFFFYTIHLMCIFRYLIFLWTCSYCKWHGSLIYMICINKRIKIKEICILLLPMLFTAAGLVAHTGGFEVYFRSVMFTDTQYCSPGTTFRTTVPSPLVFKNCVHIKITCCQCAYLNL